MIFHVFHTPAIADHAKTSSACARRPSATCATAACRRRSIAQRGGRTRAGAQARLAAR